MKETEARARRRWISFGEIIALAALIVSGLGLWLTWKGSQQDEPTRIVEQKQAIPLVLRGTVESDGTELAIAPVESTHALESLTLTLPDGSKIEAGSDGRLSARDLEPALKSYKDEKNAQSVRVRVAARHVEMGTDHSSTGNYWIRYRWEGGGLFDSRSLRILGFSR